MKQCPFRSSAGMNAAIVNANAGSNKDNIRKMLETAGACRTDCQLWDPDRQDCKLGVMAQALNSIAVETKKPGSDKSKLPEAGPGHFGHIPERITDEPILNHNGDPVPPEIMAAAVLMNANSLPYCSCGAWWVGSGLQRQQVRFEGDGGPVEPYI